MREYDQERNGHMKKQAWMKLLEEQKYSGMNMKRFCDERNISYDLFKYYKYSIRNKDQSTSLPAFIPVKQASDETLTFTLNGNTVSFDSKVSKDAISLIVKAMIS